MNLTVPVSEVREHLERVQQEEIEYLFLSPEQLRKAETIENLKSANISLFVAAEAHCISAWGHNFRHDDLRFGHPRVLGLTATAEPRVRAYIVRRLGIAPTEGLRAGLQPT